MTDTGAVLDRQVFKLAPLSEDINRGDQYPLRHGAEFSGWLAQAQQAEKEVSPAGK